MRTFVDAADHARAGRSVYEAPEYTYLPFLAWILLLFPDFDAAIVPWTAASIASAWGAVTATVVALRGALKGWRAPLVWGLGLVTIMYNQVTVIQQWLGQTDFFLMLLLALAVLLASFRQSALSGVALALAALLKTWPAMIGLWLLRRGAPRRAWSVVAAVATGAVGLLVVALVSGPATLVEAFEKSLVISRLDLVPFSVWGIGGHLFTDSGNIEPLVEAPVLGAIISWALAIGVIALIALILWRPGDDSLSMWNLVAAVTLLLPLSHLSYRLLVLPLLWVWAAHALSDRRRWTSVVMVALLGLFWVVTFRLTPVNEVGGSSPWHYLLVMAVGIAAIAASVLAAARRTPQVSSSATQASDPAAVA
nr:glycosyltransferase 87 family protein [Microbacterium ulmi]